MARFFLLVALAAFPADAQPVRLLSGAVTGASSGAAIVGAHVSAGGVGAVTDGRGQYELRLVDEQARELVVRALGYQTTRLPFDQKSDTIRVDVRLRAAIYEMGEVVVEHATLSGSNALSLPGAVHVIGPREIGRFASADVNRVLRRVPGVYVSEEDGYGLRPNIGLRGSGSERSEKITVLEDGVPVAPAPYSAPAAYYFPTVARMAGLEVQTGASQIRTGPITTSGALNLISQPIPDGPNAVSGSADARTLSHGGRLLHLYAGRRWTHGGILIQALRNQSDGFKALDTGAETGFGKTDLLAKAEVHTDAAAAVQHRLSVKLSMTSELSDETYLGLSAPDFAATPFRRYAGSQIDEMDAEQRQAAVRYTIEPSPRTSAQVTGYATAFERNWYKLDKVDAGGGAVGISSILSAPSRYAAETAILSGTPSSDDALLVKANNRAYRAEGLQASIRTRFETGRMEHRLEIGARLHRDQMDRFQWVDGYRMEAGDMSRTSRGDPGSDSNRLESADAISGHLQVRSQIGRVTLLPGLRHENVVLRRDDWGTSDPERTGADLKTRRNHVAAWIPGVGVDVEIEPGIHAFGGVHRGFAPPGSQQGAEPEQSVAYELGARVERRQVQASITGFWSDYANLLGSDLAAAGGGGTTERFNGGEATTYGLEAAADTDAGTVLGLYMLRLPLRVAYTYTSSRFDHGFESTFGPWGTVAQGDELPYQPRHQGYAEVGVIQGRAEAFAALAFTGRMRTQAGQGPFDPDRTISAHATLDLRIGYRISGGVYLYATLRNATNEVYAVADRPAGLRPGLPRTFAVGASVAF